MCDLSANWKDLNAIAANEQYATWVLGHGGPVKRADLISFLSKNQYPNE